MALSGNCMIPPLPPLGGCCPPPARLPSRQVVRVSIPGIQGPPGEKGAAGFSTRFCASLDPGQTAALTNLRPAVGAQPGDQAVNSSGQLFSITAVTESDFTVGEVVGAVGVQIDDEQDSPDTTWSGAKLAARLGEPADFVEIFETALQGQSDNASTEEAKHG